MTKSTEKVRVPKRILHQMRKHVEEQERRVAKAQARLDELRASVARMEAIGEEET